MSSSWGIQVALGKPFDFFVCCFVCVGSGEDDAGIESVVHGLAFASTPSSISPYVVGRALSRWLYEGLEAKTAKRT